MALSSPFSSSLHRRLCFPLPRLRVSKTPRFVRVSPKSVRFDRILTSESESEMTNGFFEAIEELERMVRDPSDVLNEMIERLSSRELQLVLVYFSQEGRDSYCALEVFDWLKKENRVDGETMDLMVSIACGWIERLVSGEHAVDEVVGLLNEMECVGVKPGFSMVESWPGEDIVFDEDEEEGEGEVEKDEEGGSEQEIVFDEGVFYKKSHQPWSEQ